MSTGVSETARDPHLIGMPEAAGRLGISPVTAMRLAARGQFPGDAAKRVGRRWVVSVVRLETYLHGTPE